MGVKITDKSGVFVKASTDAVDRSLNRMSIDIERQSKFQVPFLKGQLKASGSHQRMGIMKYRVSYNKVYALYQHEGGDGKRVVKKYSMPGKKKHYLIDPAKMISARGFNYLTQEIAHISI